jgi:hypothetical protein
MTIHYKSKSNQQYPQTACGKGNMSMDTTDDKEQVTCKTCLRAINRKPRVVKNKKRIISA